MNLAMPGDLRPVLVLAALPRPAQGRSAGWFCEGRFPGGFLQSNRAVPSQGRYGGVPEPLWAQRCRRIRRAQS